MRRLGVALLSLFLACVLWFFVSAPRRERPSQRAFAAPLTIVGMPRDLMITSQVPDSVSVRLSGRVSDLRSLNSQNLEVTVDVSSFAQPGEASITIRPQAINVPPGVDVVSINPKGLRFHIEAVRQRVVRIRPFLVGEPRVGYRAGDATVFPDRALVSGPASQVRNVTEVTTERIIMTGRTEAFTQSVAVVSDSPFIRVDEPLAVDVTVPVLAEFGPNLPMDTTGPPASRNGKDRK